MQAKAMDNLTDYPLLVFPVTFFLLWLSERIGSLFFSHSGHC
jgi:hypothetical protein